MESADPRWACRKSSQRSISTNTNHTAGLCNTRCENPNTHFWISTNKQIIPNMMMFCTHLDQFVLGFRDDRIKRFAMCENLAALNFLMERTLEQRPWNLKIHQKTSTDQCRGQNISQHITGRAQYTRDNRSDKSAIFDPVYCVSFRHNILRTHGDFLSNSYTWLIGEVRFEITCSFMNEFHDSSKIRATALNWLFLKIRVFGSLFTHPNVMLSVIVPLILRSTVRRAVHQSTHRFCWDSSFDFVCIEHSNNSYLLGKTTFWLFCIEQNYH